MIFNTQVVQMMTAEKGHLKMGQGHGTEAVLLPGFAINW